MMLFKSLRSTLFGEGALVVTKSHSLWFVSMAFMKELVGRFKHHSPQGKCQRCCVMNY